MTAILAASLLAGVLGGTCTDGDVAQCALSDCAYAEKLCALGTWGRCRCVNPTPPPPELAVTVVNAMHKIRASDPPPNTKKSIEISSAKNEFEAYQIVIRGPATNVRVTASAMSGPGGASLSAATCNSPGNVRVYREDLYVVASDPKSALPPPSDVDAITGAIPDALVPQVDEFDNLCRAFDFSVPANTTRVLWVDVFVPANVPAGTYSGTVTVSATEGSSTVSASVTVWDFVLPATSSMRSYVPYGYGALPSQHGVASCSIQFTNLLSRYATLALDHRFTLTYYDDGCAIDPAHVGGAYRPLLNGTAPTRLVGARVTSIAVQGALEDVGNVARWANYFGADPVLSALLVAYTADEPKTTTQWAVVGPRGAAAHDGGHPYVKTLVTQSIEHATQAIGAPGSSFTLSDIDIFCPVIDQVEPFPNGSTRSSYNAWLTGDPRREVWEYQSCDTHGCAGDLPLGSPTAPGATHPIWPSLMIDHSLVRARALEWLSFKNSVSGELYYSATMAFGAGNDPWINQYDPLVGGNGDGTLFYPGTPAKVGGGVGQDIPIASMRMKMIREGMEDFEYMKMLEGRNNRTYALDEIATVFSSAYNTEADVTKLYAARAAMACKILQLAGKSCPASACVPATCSGRCGTFPDGCGGNVSCACAGQGLKCYDPGTDSYVPSGMMCSSSVCEPRPCP